MADELDPGLVAVLTGRPCDLHLLEVMARGNSFIELVPGHYDRYRYHALFREFLRGQLAFESPELVGELHRVAAGWLAGDGQVFAAIRHAARAQDWQMATELLVDHLGFAELLMGWKGERLRRLVHRPAGRRARHGRGRHPGGAVAVRAGPAPQRAAPGGRAEAAGRRTFPPDPGAGLAIAVLHAVAASLGADTDAGLRAALVAERAIRLAPTRDLDALVELSAIVSGCKGRVLFERGDLEAGSPAFATGWGRPRRHTSRGRRGAEGDVGAGGGGDRPTASGHRARPGGARRECPDRPSAPASPGVEAATLALAWVRTDESELQLARELVRQAERQQASYDSKVLGAVLSLLRARLLWSEGDFELALAELRGAGEPLDLGSGSFTAPVTGWLAETLVVGEAASLVALEQARGGHRAAAAPRGWRQHRR